MFLKVSQNSQENIKKETPPLAASVDRPLTKNVIPRIMKVKRDIYYPFKWIQLIDKSSYLNMNSYLHLSNKLKECDNFFSYFIWTLTKNVRSKTMI